MPLMIYNPALETYGLERMHGSTLDYEESAELAPLEYDPLHVELEFERIMRAKTPGLMLCAMVEDWTAESKTVGRSVVRGETASVLLARLRALQQMVFGYVGAFDIAWAFMIMDRVARTGTCVMPAERSRHPLPDRGYNSARMLGWLRVLPSDPSDPDARIVCEMRRQDLDWGSDEFLAATTRRRALPPDIKAACGFDAIKEDRQWAHCPRLN